VDFLLFHAALGVAWEARSFLNRSDIFSRAKAGSELIKSEGRLSTEPRESRSNATFLNVSFMMEKYVPRRHLMLWLIVICAIAVIALAAGYWTFGGANMGR
jgi:hypothetical protein